MSRSWETSSGNHSPGRRTPRGPGRRPLAKILVLGIVLIALVAGGATALASGGMGDAFGRNLAGASDVPPPPPPAPAPAVLTTAPLADATGVKPRDPVHTDVTTGELRDVALTSAKGRKVAGTLSADRRSWSATEPLGFDTTYRWSGTWARADGTTAPLGGQFGTVDPARTTDARINIADDAPVGVGAPVIITFDRKLSDQAKATVERALTVRASKPVEGAWAWFPDTADGSTVHYRPKTYWPANTSVTVDAPLYGLDLGKSGYGEEDVSSRFTVGRSQIVKADTRSHQIVVVRDGKEVARYDASYGKESDPNRVTRSGTHVVMSKAQKVLMTNRDYGYENLPEYWAVRISNNGEFIHANPASASAQGSRNITHGCINLSTKDAKAYFDTAQFGDPVEVVGSSRTLGPQDGDIRDWAISWNDWKSMSALAG